MSGARLVRAPFFGDRAGATGWSWTSPAPVATRLVSVQPNAFNPRTGVVFDLAAAGRVRIAVYDVEGRCVRRLLDEERPAGRHEQVWDGADDRGRPLASGVYLLRLETAAGVDRRAATLLR